MYNWNTDENFFKKHDPKGYEIWHLAQLINYGLNGEKLPLTKLKKLWPKVKTEVSDPLIKKYLTDLLLGGR